MKTGLLPNGRVDTTKFDPNLMARHKTLAESLSQNPAWVHGRYFRKFLQEAGTLVGWTDGDAGTGTEVPLEIFNQIIMGFEGHIPLDFARLFNTDKVVLDVPIGTYGTATKLTAGVFDPEPKTVTHVPITIDDEYGVLVDWTRGHLEDATWQVMSEQNEGAGYAIKAKLVALLVAELLGVGGATHVGAIVDYTDWGDWVDFLAAVDIAGYGPADFCLVNPTDYWGLLKVDQFVNSLYAGDEEVMRTGIAKTMFGITFLKVDGATVPIALNSKKAIALAYRRQLTIEPFERPETDQYGFVASVRAEEQMLQPLAAAEASA